MMNKAVKHLEDAALAARRRGDNWWDFFFDVEDSITRAEASGARHGRVLDRLCDLVEVGDVFGRGLIGHDDRPQWRGPVGSNYVQPASPLARIGNAGTN